MSAAPLAPESYERRGGPVQVWKLTEGNLREIGAAIRGMGVTAETTRTRDSLNVIELKDDRGRTMFRIGAPAVLVHEAGRWYKVPRILFEHWFEKSLPKEA